MLVLEVEDIETRSTRFSVEIAFEDEHLEGNSAEEYFARRLLF